MLEILIQLAAKTSKLIRSPGKPEYTPADIAAAMAGSNETGLDILLSKVVGDRTAQHRLFYTIYQQVVGIAVKENWKFRKGEERIRSLVNLAIFEYVCEPRCPACRGTKYVKNEPCRTCNHTGYLKLNDKQRAEALGIHPSVWLRTWKARYARVFQVLNCHESDAIRNLYKRLT